MGTELFLGFSLDAWITIVTVLGMFSVLLFTKLRSDWVFLSAIGVLYVTGVLDAKEAFSGFSGFVLSIAAFGFSAVLGIFVSIICRVREIFWILIGILLMKIIK